MGPTATSWRSTPICSREARRASARAALLRFRLKGTPWKGKRPVKLLIAYDLHGAAPAVRFALVDRIESRSADQNRLAGRPAVHGYVATILPVGYTRTKVADRVINGLAQADSLKSLRGNCRMPKFGPDGARLYPVHGRTTPSSRQSGSSCPLPRPPAGQVPVGQHYAPLPAEHSCQAIPMTSTLGRARRRAVRQPGSTSIPKGRLTSYAVYEHGTFHPEGLGWDTLA